MEKNVKEENKMEQKGDVPQKKGILNRFLQWISK